MAGWFGSFGKCAGKRAATAAAALFAAALLTMAAQPKFYPDDPIAREPDPADASRVQPFAVHLNWDILSSLFVKEGELEPRRAQNINTIGEVPDSSWFTNRAGSQSLTAAAVGRGPDTTEGPAPGKWTIVSGKSEGIRPGFTIMDPAGIRWFLKFDAPGYPEQATAAEVVSTKLFWALGYYVAETHVATLRPDDLVVGSKATIRINGKPAPLTGADVRRVLSEAERSPDGTYRVLASKELEGKSVGEFLYYGTRADDPNDIVPHENRRELRGMAVFASWIDRVDAKAGNTLDTLVKAEGKTVVRHHPLDFGSTLGSAGIGPNEYWEGYAYLYAGRPLAKKLFGFGLPVEWWRTIPYPRLRGIGRFEGERFDPEQWKSRVPNAAYLRADAEDTFWAARKVVAISDEMIAAAVKSGQYTDPAAEAYMTGTLIQRRDAIGRAFLTKINPVVNPALSGGTLTFENAAVEAKAATGDGISYRAAWYRFDLATSASQPIGDSGPSPIPTLQCKSPLPPEGSIVRIDIRTQCPRYTSWDEPVRVFFRNTGAGWKLIGLERGPEGGR